MQAVQVKTNFVNGKMALPKYAHEGDAGFDLQANIIEGRVIKPKQTIIIPTGLFVALPKSGVTDWEWEIQIRPRSGLAAKYGITVLNAPGTIDQGYRNEIGVILHNSSQSPITVEPGDRIAQGVLARAYKIKFDEVNEFTDETERGLGGFGSTGTN